MSEHQEDGVNSLMDEIFAQKQRARLDRAALSFTDKIVILEKMRRRNQELARNPLRTHHHQPSIILTTYSGGKLQILRKGVVKPRVLRQSPVQSTNAHNTATVSVITGPLTRS